MRRCLFLSGCLRVFVSVCFVVFLCFSVCPCICQCSCVCWCCTCMLYTFNLSRIWCVCLSVLSSDTLYVYCCFVICVNAVLSYRPRLSLPLSQVCLRHIVCAFACIVGLSIGLPLIRLLNCSLFSSFLFVSLCLF